MTNYNTNMYNLCNRERRNQNYPNIIQEPCCRYPEYIFDDDKDDNFNNCCNNCCNQNKCNNNNYNYYNKQNYPNNYNNFNNSQNQRYDDNFNSKCDTNRDYHKPDFECDCNDKYYPKNDYHKSYDQCLNKDFNSRQCDNFNYCRCRNKRRY